MNRHTAAALIGWGSFLSVASGFAIALTLARFEVFASGLIGVVVGGIVGVASRHGVDRSWPRGITGPDDDRSDVDLDGLLDAVRRDSDTPTTWAEMRPIGPDLPDATALMPLKKIPGYERKHQAGAR